VSDFRFRGLFVLVILVCVASLPGCSGKSAITITLTPAGSSACGTTTTSSCAVTLNPGQLTESITAAVANDPTNAGVTWSLGSSVGSLSGSSPTSVTYVAPTAVSQTATATVTATAIANTSITATVTITINAVFEFESSALPVATVDVPYNGVISTIGATGPFTWIILSGNLPAGLTLSNSNTASVTITGTPTTVGTSTVTIQATDGTGSPISRTFTITVNPPPALTIVTPATITAGTVDQAYSFTLQAEFGTPPYTWSITSGSLPGGSGSLSLSRSGVISGTPMTVGTSSFTVQVQDSATPNPAIASKSLTLTINQVLVNSQLMGNYAFLVSGFDAVGKRFVAAGSFTASGGSISSGEIDTNDAGVHQSLTGQSGTYSIAANGVGTLTVAGLTFYLSFVPTNSATGIPSANLIEFDNTTRQASGVLLQQTTPFSTPSGNYAFGFLGNDPTNQRYALAGSFAASSGGFLDSDDAGTPQTKIPFTVSALGIPDSNGRGTFAFSVGGTATNYAYYIVDGNQVLVVDTDPGSVPTVSGTMLAQSGSLGASSLNDAVFETTAVTSGTALTQLGVMTTDGISKLSTSFDKSTGGGIQSSSGTYSVDSTTGRTTLTTSGLQTSSDPVLYLVQPNEGFLVGTDAAVTFGFIKAQTSTSTLTGTYAGGSIPPALSGPSGQVDVAGANSSTLAFTYDASTGGGLLQNQSTSSTFAAPVTNGRGTIATMPPMPPGSPAIFYVVAPTEFWTMTPSANGMIQIFQATGAVGIFQQ
jgi:hypothetical protein